jgi:hypothetical protein
MPLKEYFRLRENNRLVCRMHVENPDALTVRSPDSFIHLHVVLSMPATCEVSASATGGVFDPDQFQTRDTLPAPPTAHAAIAALRGRPSSGIS